MPEYKLTYFDFKGRAEIHRFLFALAEVPYIDHRISFEEFAKLKPTLPYGQVPILEVDGTILSQSGTIARFLANKFGLYGKDALEAAKIDEIVDASKDYGDVYTQVRKAREAEPAVRSELLKTFVEVASPKYLTKFSQLLEANGGKYFVGNKWTWADVTIFFILDLFASSIEVDVTKNYPVLLAFVKNFREIPQIKKWIDTRPKTAL